MMKKMMIILAVLAFCGGSLLTMASCAKKGVISEEVATPAEPVATPEEPVKPVVQPPTGEERAAALERQRQEQLRREIQAFESGNIYFDFDKSELRPEARAILEKKAAWLNDNPEFSVRIEGHCDERGTNEYNLALGERRANAAMKYLNALGVAGDRMITVSYGEERPAVPGSNEAAWAKNRRDEFKLIR
ncbi:MAG: peptidoglycan-associated lipoprotein Pal [Desulfatiglandales bacterium]